jgi:predicted nucleic acid-binding protein
MSGFLLDTNVPSELIRMRPDPRVAQWLRDADDNMLYLSVISIGEVCKGFTVHPEEHRRVILRRWLDDTLRPWFAGRILPISEPVSERWGDP